MELDAGAELEATKWREGHRCGARQWHGPRQRQDRRMWSTVATRDASPGAKLVSAGEGEVCPASGRRERGRRARVRVRPDRRRVSVTVKRCYSGSGSRRAQAIYAVSKQVADESSLLRACEFLK
jgi:hypothetical protein